MDHLPASCTCSSMIPTLCPSCRRVLGPSINARATELIWSFIWKNGESFPFQMEVPARPKP